MPASPCRACGCSGCPRSCAIRGWNRLSQVIECLDTINDALRHVRHDPEAMICAVDREGRCFVAEATSHCGADALAGHRRVARPADAGEARARGGQHGGAGGLFMNRVARDLTPVVDLTLESGTGPFRTRRPVYVDLLPPCNHACPAGENIQGWLALAQAGDYRKAWEIAGRRQPAAGDAWPGLLSPVRKRLQSRPDRRRGVDPRGRTLPRRHGEGGGLGLSRPARRRRASACWWSAPVPAGLSAAYHLTRLGHQVEIHEAGPVAGGMLQFGIPAYRLPRAELAEEVARIERFGVKIVLNHPVTDVLAEQQRGKLRRGVRGDRRACGAARRYPGARRGARAGCGLDAARHRHRRARRTLGPPRRHLRRRQYGDGRRAHGPSPRRGGSADRLSPRPRAHARARFRGRRGDGGRRQNPAG